MLNCSLSVNENKKQVFQNTDSTEMASISQGFNKIIQRSLHATECIIIHDHPSKMEVLFF
jgi:hypothetical protein